MSRNYRLYIKDILTAIKKIERYTNGMDHNEFKKDELIQDGVIRNLEIIGEAVKKVPEDIKDEYPEIEWRKIAGLRDILIHAYFNVDIEILWDIIQNKLPDLKEKIEKILEKE